ncbi:ribose/xylose/arabinose/galactoside ABC-type transport system permease subunit [Nakamurella flavida]|uniref:ABC transporter permease n=1 Tax=Nakamurella flavida TaxID=363630 RepID=UPI0027861D8B|nr:ABC transporter permease [Nakamurella flavida]MDP9778527.1 ribose/xylose/arabinose/galactoside ABC-type transport system permease subunit [Nakamurella flavida]
MTAVAVAAPPAARRLVVLRQIRTYLLPVLLIVEVVLFALLSPQFLTAQNWVNIATNSADLALVAAGLTLIILMAGIDVSTGFAVGLVGWFVATGMSQAYPPVLVLLVALLIGAVLGLANGLLTVRLSIPSIVATLGTSAIFQAALFFLWDSTDVFARPVFPWLSGQSRLFGIPVVALLVVAVYAVLQIVLSRTVFGRSIYAIGSNVEAAQLAGISISRVRLGAYLLLGALVGLAAVLYSARIGVVQASSGGELTMLAIAAVVVGGTSILGGEGSVLRTLGGLLFIAVLRNGVVLAGVPSLWNGVLIGLVILLAVVVNGLVIRASRERQRSV